MPKGKAKGRYNFEKDPLVIERNEKPFNCANALAFSSLEEGQSILILYGQAHWKDLKKRFKEVGYKVKTLRRYFPF